MPSVIHLNSRLKDQKNKIFFEVLLTPSTMKKMFAFYMLSNLLMMLATLASGQDIPSITAFAPSSGYVGTTVTVTGINFGASAESNIVYFGATKGTVISATATQL